MKCSDTGKMDIPSNTNLRRKTWPGSESTKGKENSFAICESCKALIHDGNQCNNPAWNRREIAELTNLSRNDVAQQYEMKGKKKKRQKKQALIYSLMVNTRKVKQNRPKAYLQNRCLIKISQFLMLNTSKHRQKQQEASFLTLQVMG